MLSKAAGLKARRGERQKTRIFGTVSYVNERAVGRVVDLSESGMALDLSGPFHAANGSKVSVASEEFGVLEGTVRWRRAGRLGVMFEPNSKASAQVASYFRFFHRHLKTTPAR